MILVKSSLRSRTYERRFDYDEAWRRYQAGERVADLAAEYGVTKHAVWRALSLLRDPVKRSAMREANRRWRTGVCEDCGGPAMRLVGGKAAHNHDGRVLCITCRSIERSESLRFDDHGNLTAVRCNTRDCANGEPWQRPENFGRGRRFKAMRDGGFHQQCRACLTRARQDYRERHKVPCTNCGKPTLPASEKGKRGRDTGLCITCWHKSPEGLAAGALARTRSVEARRRRP